MKSFWIFILILVLVGCEDMTSPTAPSPIDELSSGYIPVFRGRCPSDNDLPFNIRENGWYWVDRCQNNYGETVQLSDWCSGTRSVEGDYCALTKQSETRQKSLLVTWPPAVVINNACHELSISGGSPPYTLTSTPSGGFGSSDQTCTKGHAVKTYRVSSAGLVWWSGTGLETGVPTTLRASDSVGATSHHIITER